MLPSALGDVLLAVTDLGMVVLALQCLAAVSAGGSMF